MKRFVCISTNCRSDHNLLIFFSQKKSLIEQEVPVAGKWSVLMKKTRIDMKIDPFRNIYDIAKKKKYLRLAPEINQKILIDVNLPL